MHFDMMEKIEFAFEGEIEPRARQRVAQSSRTLREKSGRKPENRKQKRIEKGNAKSPMTQPNHKERIGVGCTDIETEKRKI